MQQKNMNYRGFFAVLSVVLALFLTFHLLLRSDLTRKREQTEEMTRALARLEEEHRDLSNQLSVVGTEDYIVSSAMQNYSYVSRDDIRFEFTNPEALYAYTDAEIQILMEELGD